MNYSLRLCLLFVFALPMLLFSQENNMQYGIRTSAYSAVEGDDLPFWFYSNRHGMVDEQSSNLITSFYSHYKTGDSEKTISFESGIDVFHRFSSNNTLGLNELYGSVGYRFLEFNAGRFYDPIGLNDHDLTMGSMQMSRNAPAVPKIQLATDGFTDIPFTQGYVQFKSMLSHGWLEDDRYVQNAYLHQKYFYLKINYKMLEGMGGIVHNAIWGGTHPKYGQLPSSFGDFLRVISGSGAAEDSNAPRGDVENAIGNMVAAYDFRLNVHLNNFNIKAYRLFYLEDRVAAQFRSPWDGMWGLGVSLKEKDSFINEVLWEHMNTKRQDAFDFEPRGVSNYYNHFEYQSGWTYENEVLGNPLILFGPNSNFVSTRTISNNIIIAHHFGIKGMPSDTFQYKALFTYSRNYGTEDDQTQEDPHIPLQELRVDEYSILMEGIYHVESYQGLSVIGSVALDIGKLYESNRVGFQVGIRWNGIIK